ncbi:hypothetical protein [Fibrella forsythiae]|uniref:Uncharacterized protein n=1 Tax=Fibrella forsythiae TaxID=2817061 RepID=A0ABS3JBF6_9BACT|nr:hypothetical protein [Fibrella forsythiae]MBO0947316.1 hypothetical protein [Fibrella forsythiae]
MVKPIDTLLAEIQACTTKAELDTLMDYISQYGRQYTLVDLRQYKEHRDAKLMQLINQFIDHHFPPATVRALKKVDFFKKGKLTHEDIEARVCQFFGLDSIFEYAKIGEGTGVHLSLTKKGIDEGVQANFIMGQSTKSTETT